MNAPGAIERFCVSLSGADNIGKTSILRLFPRHWPLLHTKGLHDHSEAVAEMLHSRSWFGTADIDDADFPKGACSDEDFVVNIAEACQRRHQAYQTVEGSAHKNATIIVNNSSYQLPGLSLDRGGQMFEAVCIARIAVLRQIEVAEAEEVVQQILTRNALTFPSETVSILIRLEGTVQERVDWTLHHEDATSHATAQALYTRYQHALQNALDRQVSRGAYTAVISKGRSEPFIETLARVTAILQDSTGTSYVWQPLLANIQKIVAYGGLSECGKSTMCTATVDKAGANGFRVKIAYLCDLISARLNMNVYTLPESTIALELIHELDLFCRWHRWLSVVTLDSLHNYLFTKRLTELLGNAVCGPECQPSGVPVSMNVKLLVVYLDTPLHLRISRTEAEGKKFDTSKDEVKKSRGADKIKEVADLVVANDGLFNDTFAEVWRVLEKYGTPT